MKGLILAGGHGTRLRPLTHTGPKQLIPIANKPNILYCLEDLRDAGITDIGVILGDVMPEKVKELLGDGQAHGVGISYAVFCLKKKRSDELVVPERHEPRTCRRLAEPHGLRHL